MRTPKVQTAPSQTRKVSVVRRRDRYYLRIWDAGKIVSERSAETKNRRDAERAAIALEGQLALEVEQWKYVAA